MNKPMKNLTAEEYRDWWLAARREGVSASDVAPIVGLYAYGRTAYSVYCEKRGLVEDKETTEQMEFGKEIEQIIARKWSKRTGIPHVWLDQLTIGEEPWMLSTPDAEVREIRPDEGLEIKSTGYKNPEEWGDEGSDHVPEHVLCQVSWQMLVNKWHAVNIALFETGKRRLWTYKVYRDEELIASLKDRCRTFWFRHVLPGKPPEIDWSEAASAYLKARFPLANTDERDSTVNEDLIVNQFVKMRRESKRLELEIQTLGNRIKETIGNDKILKGPNYKATYMNVAGSTYTVTREPGRQLRITGKITKGEE
jgi:putative phage-type endonuclease